MRTKYLKNLIAQVEYGHKLKSGACLSYYLTDEAQNKSIRETSEVEKLSEKLEKILNSLGVYNLGNKIDFKWVNIYKANRGTDSLDEKMAGPTICPWCDSGCPRPKEVRKNDEQ